MNNQEYTEIVEGYINYIIVENGQINTDDFVNKSLILSGSFNPLHNGHIGLLKTAKNMIKLEPFFEISISNVDKSNITLEDLNSRISQFDNVGKLLITNSPTFEDKSNIFKKSIFVIGYDTAERILQDKYYNDSTTGALQEIYNFGCSFLVAGRKVDKEFLTSSDLNLKDNYKRMFKEIPEKKFRMDISSSYLRKQNGFKL